MLFIGDVHGKLDQYARILDQHELLGEKESIQLGDMGVGFVTSMNMGGNHRFIRGNHDNPALCNVHPNYLGDYGFLKEERIFYVSGAYSIDWMHRIPGKSWWNDEELSMAQLTNMINEYRKMRPDVVVSHDCPTQVRKRMLPQTMEIKTRTDQALQICFESFKPALWLFGHHHMSRTENIAGTEFRCLDELETVVI